MRSHVTSANGNRLKNDHVNRFVAVRLRYKRYCTFTRLTYIPGLLRVCSADK